MADLDPTSEGGTGLSRRTLIKGGAAVGGLVWAAPVIDSFTSAASAASNPPINFGCSWAYIIYEDANGGLHYTGFQNDTSTQCNNDAADPPPHNNASVDCGGGTTFTLNSVQGGAPPPIDFTFGGNSGQLTQTTDGCSDFSFSGTDGRTVTGTNGITILAFFAFGANLVSGGCASAGSVTITCGGQS